jgi:hypothetical protein
MQECGWIWPAREHFLSGVFGRSMTAIAVDYSTSGFAIAADGRGRWFAEDATEDVSAREQPPAVKKIFKIQNRHRVMAYALTGTGFSDDLKFSLIAKAKRSADSLAALDFDDPRAYIRRFSARIKEAYERAKRAGQFRSFPTESSSAIDGGLFQVARIIFAGYFDGEPFIGIGTIPHRDQIVLDATVDVWTPMAGSLPLVCGSAIIPRMMFADNDPALARYLVRPRSGSSLEEAVARAKGCVEAQCSNEAAAIDPFCRDQVGGPVLVATVTKQFGFQWVKPSPPQ